ncbi:phosphatase PAP2 family protein [Bordetella petrii]|nr:phosphatase PAP2 family protein [Bordetella petrii]
MTQPHGLSPDSLPAVPTAMPAIPPRPCRSVALTVCFAVVLLLMSRWVDVPLTQAIERHMPEQVNEVFDQIGDLGDSEGYILAGLLLYAVSLFGMRRGWACPVRAGFERLARYSMLLLATMSVGGLITLLLKKIVSRARPEVLLEQGWHGLGVPFAGDPYDSFPSSHTLTAFAVAAVIGQIAPRWRLPLLLVAAIVAVSRVVNRDHFLSDVTAAAFIAIMVAHYLAPYILGERYRWMLRAPWRWASRG